jgi:hypothetical protein
MKSEMSEYSRNRDMIYYQKMEEEIGFFIHGRKKYWNGKKRNTMFIRITGYGSFDCQIEIII